MYEYNAVIKRVVDGDTLMLEVDLGFYTYTFSSFRLARIDAPERGTPGGTAATEFVREWEGQSVRIVTSKNPKDKYGRYLAEVFVRMYGLAESERNLNDLLVERGYAKYWNGKGEKPV